MATAPEVTSKSIAPVIRKTAPSQQQLQFAGTLRALGISPNNPKKTQQQAAQAGMSAEEFLKKHQPDPTMARSSKALSALSEFAGYTGSAGSAAFNANRAARDSAPPQHDGFDPASQPDIAPEYDPAFLAAVKDFRFVPTADRERAGMNIVAPDGRSQVINWQDKESGFDKLMYTAIPLVISGMAGGAFSGALGLTGAGGAAASGAVGSGLNTAVQGGKLSDILKSAVTGGLGGGLTGGLTSAGLNPLAARAVSSLTTGAITGKDPRQSLLSAIIGGVNTGNPAATSFLRAVLGAATAKKGGKS